MIEAIGDILKLVSDLWAKADRNEDESDDDKIAREFANRALVIFQRGLANARWQKRRAKRNG